MTDQSTTVAEISIDQVIAGFADLPTLAPVAMEVIRLADDENSSLADLAAAISADPGLTSRLLRLANSAMYGQSKEVTNLDRATALLGLRTVKLLSLGFTIVANLNAGPLDTAIIWRRSLATSVIARRLASQVDKAMADDAFVAGLLSNIGKIALAEQDVYVRAVTDNSPWITPGDEEQLLGFTSDEVTARILLLWGLPDVLADVIRHRANPVEGEPSSPLAGVLQVADAAAMLMLTDSDELKATALDALTMAAATHLGLTIDQLEQIITELAPDLDEIANMFDLEAIATTPITEIVISAQEHLARLSLDIASTLSQEQQRNEELTEKNQKLAAEAATDALTGLPNRRTFDAYLNNQVSGRMRNPRPSALGLIIFDLDHFKSINDNFGHAVGDEVLVAVGNRIQEGTRASELSARIGGEEFAVILPETSAQELSQAAERFRCLVGDEPIETATGPLAVTTSVGASHTTTASSETVNELYTTADAALYDSKTAGRDRVTTKPVA